MKHLTKLLTAACLLVCATALPAHADPKLWETIKTQPNVVLVGRHMDVERGRVANRGSTAPA